MLFAIRREITFPKLRLGMPDYKNEFTTISGVDGELGVSRIVCKVFEKYKASLNHAYIVPLTKVSDEIAFKGENEQKAILFEQKACEYVFTSLVMPFVL